MAKLKITSVHIIDNHNADITLEDGQEIKLGGNWEIGGEPQIGEIIDTSKFLNPFTEITNKGTFDQRKKPHRSPWY